jgi:hypothetical protein
MARSGLVLSLPVIVTLIALAPAILPTAADATTIVSVGDSGTSGPGFLFLGGQFSNVVAASWTITGSFAGVTVKAAIGSVDNGFRSGTAYLTKTIGRGTTPANQTVPQIGFTAPLVGSEFDPFPLTTLFTGINLGPGTYYLVLAAPFRDQSFSDLGWQFEANALVTVAAGVSLSDYSAANTFLSSVDSFAPASTFRTLSGAQAFFEVSNISEPASLFLTLIGLAVMIIVLVARTVKAIGFWHAVNRKTLGARLNPW